MALLAKVTNIHRITLDGYMGLGRGLLLRRVQDHPAKLVSELTPKAWALARKNARASGSDPPS